MNIHLFLHIAACTFPSGYTAAGSNTLKAYKKLSGTYTFKNAETTCRADGAWIATPRTSAELTDILGYSCKDHIKSSDSDF